MCERQVRMYDLEKRRAGIDVFGVYVAQTGRGTRIVSRYLMTSSAEEKHVFLLYGYTADCQISNPPCCTKHLWIYRMAVRRKRSRLNPTLITTSHLFPSSSDSLNGLLFILQLCKSFVHIAVVPLSHARPSRLRVGITGLPASHPAVRSAVSSRARLGSVARTRHHREPSATTFLCPLL